MVAHMANLLEHGTWVLVCDGGKALLLQNEGDQKFPNLRKQEEFESHNRPSHDLGTAKPGRVFSGKGGRHAAIEPTDLHRIAEEEFLAKVAEMLEERVRAGSIRALVLVAPPRALGVLRHRISPAVRASVRGEVEKDYVKAPIYEIERHLQAISSGS